MCVLLNLKGILNKQSITINGNIFLHQSWGGGGGGGLDDGKIPCSTSKGGQGCLMSTPTPIWNLSAVI